jgi:hypothetical protein
MRLRRDAFLEHLAHQVGEAVGKGIDRGARRKLRVPVDQAAHQIGQLQPQPQRRHRGVEPGKIETSDIPATVRRRGRNPGPRVAGRAPADGAACGRWPRGSRRARWTRAAVRPAARPGRRSARHRNRHPSDVAKRRGAPGSSGSKRCVMAHHRLGLRDAAGMAHIRPAPGMEVPHQSPVPPSSRSRPRPSKNGPRDGPRTDPS